MGLPRKLRLRRTEDYRRVQRRGHRVRQPNLLALFLPGEAGESRIGVTVSRKVGGAVTRNRVKRWLREAIRAESLSLSGCWDVVLIAHPSSASAGLTQLTREVCCAFERIGDQL